MGILRFREERIFLFSWRDTGMALLVLVCATLICAVCVWLGPGGGDNYVSMVYLFAVALVSRLTAGYFYGIAAAVVSVFGINYAFTEPYMQFNFGLAGYPLTFIILTATAVLISGMTTQLKHRQAQSYKARLEEMRANLLRAVSHDLRTPLTSISGAASLLSNNLQSMPAERQRALLLEISDDAQWLIRMVENLLSITRINAAAAGVRKSPEAAEEVIAEAVRKYRQRFPSPRAEACLPDELVMVPMDAILIGQVLANLLENAALHARGATRVRVCLSAGAGEAVFAVTDDGGGIAPERMETLFDASVGGQSDTSANSHNNMGIGLSVCRTIVMAHGGRLTARNLPEGGACFCFTLPLEKEENHA